VFLKYLKYTNLFFFFMGAGGNTGFELRAFTCKAGALPLEPYLQYFLLWLFWRQGLVFAQSGLDWDPYFKILTIPKMTSTCHHSQLFFHQDGAYKLLSQGWPRIEILPILASHMARDGWYVPACPVICI
jgi:hypothetical protein